MTGCPYGVRREDEKLYGVYTPSDPATWPTLTFRFPKGSPAWTSRGCPWPQFVEDPVLWRWVNAWELLKRFKMTPVDAGLWPRVTGEYLEVMLHLDRLSDELQADRMKHEREKLEKLHSGGFGR